MWSGKELALSLLRIFAPENPDEKLLKNLKKLNEKEKAKQQESKVYGSKQVKERRR